MCHLFASPYYTKWRDTSGSQDLIQDVSRKALDLHLCLLEALLNVPWHVLGVRLSMMEDLPPASDIKEFFLTTFVP
jgi:hypothetical protein